MRKLIENQIEGQETPRFGVTLIEDIEFDPRSRDELTKTLRGLQALYMNKEAYSEINKILELMQPKGKSTEIGRRGMSFWTIFVLGTLRLSCNIDYDRLKELYDYHNLVRQMCGLDIVFGVANPIPLQTLHDNVGLFTEETAIEISNVVVNYGHRIVKKKEERLDVRCDSFAFLSNVHFPTDFNLLLDVSRVLINECQKIANTTSILGWREHKSQFLKIKREYNSLSKMRYSNSKSDKKILERKTVIHARIRYYLSLVKKIFTKVIKFQQEIGLHAFINDTLNKGNILIHQVERRVFKEEKIQQEDKIYSIFEPYTEWICKGKAGVRQELGVKVCIVEDQFGFILTHRVMQKEQDKDIAFPIIQEVKNKFPNLNSVSFDKGFHSKNDNNGENNRTRIETLLNVKAFLPKKGKKNKVEAARESTEEFVKSRKQHPAVESGINALESHGLDRCPDRGEVHYKRYVAMGIMAANIHKLGAILVKKELAKLVKQAA